MFNNFVLRNLLFNIVYAPGTTKESGDVPKRIPFEHSFLCVRSWPSGSLGPYELCSFRGSLKLYFSDFLKFREFGKAGG